MTKALTPLECVKRTGLDIAWRGPKVALLNVEGGASDVLSMHWTALAAVQDGVGVAFDMANDAAGVSPEDAEWFGDIARSARAHLRGWGLLDGDDRHTQLGAKGPEKDSHGQD